MRFSVNALSPTGAASPMKRKSTQMGMDAMVSPRGADLLVVAAPVIVRGPRLRQILETLPIDNMEAQLLAREFFARCDLQQKYMSLEKFADVFGLGKAIARRILDYMWNKPLLNDVPYNYVCQIRKRRGNDVSRRRQSLAMDDYNDHASAIINAANKSPEKRSERRSLLHLPPNFVTLENFLEAAVYLTTRSTMEERMHLAFAIFDENNDGVVEASEIERVMLQSWGKVSDTNEKKNSNNDAAKNNENLFTTEVGQLIEDLKDEFQTDQFTKDIFLQFSGTREFLTSLLVNKHWLRDILSDDKANTRYARPQDAQMKEFLQAIVEEEQMSEENIETVQEQLRDHLIESLDDLKDIKLQDLQNMNLNKKISILITKKVNHSAPRYSRSNGSFAMTAEDDYASSDGVIDEVLKSRSMNIADDMISIGGEPSMVNEWWSQTTIPFRVNLLMFILISALAVTSYVLWGYSNSIHLSNYDDWSSTAQLTTAFGYATNNVLHLCYILLHFQLLYPMLSRYFYTGLGCFGLDTLLYFTSDQFSQFIGAIFLSFTALHLISYQCAYIMLSPFTPPNGEEISNFNSTSISVTGYIGLLLLFVMTVVVWKGFLNQTTNQRWYKIRTQVFTVMLIASFVCFTLHCISKVFSQPSYMFLITITIIAVIDIWYFMSHLVLSKPMDVVISRPERPNCLIVTIERPPNFTPKPGQYVEFNCPDVAKFEFHPYFVTSSPNDKYLQLNCLTVGDWSRAVWSTFTNEDIQEYPAIRIAGPFGEGFTSVSHCDALLIVASGNGTDAIASVLNYGCSLLDTETDNVFRIYFYWMVAPDNAAYWFYKMVRSLREIHGTKFDANIFITSASATNDVQNLGLNFFLSLRRDSMQTQALIAQSRLSAGRVSNFRRPVSVFNASSNRGRFSRVSTIGAPSVVKMASPSRSNSSNVNLEETEDIIPMKSPDFRSVFQKIREDMTDPELAKEQMVHKKHVSRLTNQNDSIIRGIVPELLASSKPGCISGTVGVLYAGPELIARRLKSLSEQHTDNNVLFQFQSMVVNDDHSRKYSTKQ